MFDLKNLNSDEFQGSLDRLPTAQLLLSTGNMKTTGLENSTPILFIKEQSVKQAGFISDVHGIHYKHQYRNGNAESGIAFNECTINVIAKSDRFIELTQKAEDQGVGSRGQIIGSFDTPEGASLRNSMPKELTTLRTIYMIMLLDKSGNFIHRVPIALAVKGGAAYYFGTALEDFYATLQSAYANSKYGNPNEISIFNSKARSICSFTFTLGTAPVGEGDLVADVPCVETYVTPDATNKIENFFNSKNAEKIFSLTRAVKDFDQRYFKQFEEYHPVNNVRTLSIAPAPSAEDAEDIDF